MTLNCRRAPDDLKGTLSSSMTEFPGKFDTAIALPKISHFLDISGNGLDQFLTGVLRLHVGHVVNIRKRDGPGAPGTQSARRTRKSSVRLLRACGVAIGKQ